MSPEAPIEIFTFGEMLLMFSAGIIIGYCIGGVRKCANEETFEVWSHIKPKNEKK